MSTKLSTVTLTMLSIIVFAQMSGLAQDTSSRENGKKLEGVWTIITANRDCSTGVLGRTFPSMETFARGGTSVEFSLGAATSGLANLGNRTSSQGIWNYGSNGVYTSASQFYRFDISNVYIGSARRDAEILLSDDGETFTSNGTEKFYNPAGVLTGTRCNAQSGSRFR
jgi:hypothetical protein